MMVFVDVSSCGIGNIVLMIAGFLYSCRRLGVQPVVVSTTPQGVEAGIKTGSFQLRTTRPTYMLEAHPSKYCNLATLQNPDVIKVMREIVRVPEGLDAALAPLEGVVAGFCIRTEDEAHDGASRFLAPEAVAALKASMSQYSKVFACSNDAANLEDLPEQAVVLERTDRAARNIPSHWLQWHALSRCPIVFHGVSSEDGRVTSTFAPTAAVYGSTKVLEAVDSATGEVLKEYRW